MFCSVQSMGLSGIESYPVTVEVDCRRGLPRFDIVGLPDTAVKESRERVHSAIGNLGYTFPAGVLVVNLAPADTKKSGPLYDLPILLGILAASGAVRLPKTQCAFLGELSLQGELRRRSPPAHTARSRRSPSQPARQQLSGRRCLHA